MKKPRIKSNVNVVTFELTTPEIISAVCAGRPGLLSHFATGTRVTVEAYLTPTGGRFVATSAKEPAT